MDFSLSSIDCLKRVLKNVGWYLQNEYFEKKLSLKQQILYTIERSALFLKHPLYYTLYIPKFPLNLFEL